MDVIFVKDLRLVMSIGVEPFEQMWKQTVLVSIRVSVSPDIRKSGDYFSYAPVVETLRAMAASGEHVDLVETVAETAGRAVLADARAETVEVTVSKPDVFADAAAVGITITMDRADL